MKLLPYRTCPCVVALPSSDAYPAVATAEPQTFSDVGYIVGHDGISRPR